MSVVNDEVAMEIEMLKAIAGDENVQDPGVGLDGAPASMRNCPALRILISRELGAAPELVLWIGFHSPAYPGGDASCVPLVKVELEESAPINHRPQEYEVKVRETAVAEGGQMCINQIYQRCVDCLVEAEEAKSKQAHNAAAAAADASAAATTDPTIRIGTQMSPEVFRAWKVQFDAERAAKAAKEAGKQGRGGGGGGGADAKNLRLTGRQMWDQTLKTADWKLFEKAEGAAGEDDDDIEDVDFVFGDEDEDGADGGDGAAGRAGSGEGEEGEEGGDDDDDDDDAAAGANNDDDDDDG